jgi:hypothetical protein
MIIFKPYGRDFKAIQEDVNEYLPDDVCQLLDHGISDDIKEILLEAPYVDKDFRDTYYNDFSKRFTDISRDSIRLHLFYEPGSVLDDNYAGFITLRDTKIKTIGRSYLHPKALKNTLPGYFCLAPFDVHYQGQSLTVHAFPWMQQDGNVSRCAHIAAWAINRYFSQKYPYYAERTLHEITTHDSTTRRVPSKGATVEQIAQILQRSRFDPEIYIKDNGKDKPYYTDAEFHRLMYTFIESGIPCIAGIRSRHAVVIVGDGELSDVRKVAQDATGIIDSCDLVEDFILVDDNELPYSKAYNYEVEGNYKCEDINVLIVPFYEKMYLDVTYLYLKMLPVLEKDILNINPNEVLVRRVLLTSSRSFKKVLFGNSLDSAYSKLMQQMQMPKFIWLVEYSSVDEFLNKQIRHRIVLDATMLKFQDDAFMAIKRFDELAINNKTLHTTVITDSNVDMIYVHNLGRIE